MMHTVKQISDNEIYLLIKYIKSVLWRVAKYLSYVEEARCVKVNHVVCNKVVLDCKIIYIYIDVCKHSGLRHLNTVRNLQVP